MLYYISELKNVKNMLKNFYLMVMLLIALACKATPAKPIKVPGSNDIQPSEQQSIVCRTVSSFISEYNYKKVSINDSISVVIFNRYVKLLDEGRNYFLASDVADY